MRVLIIVSVEDCMIVFFNDDYADKRGMCLCVCLCHCDEGGEENIPF